MNVYSHYIGSRRRQETHQLLRQNQRWPDPERRQSVGATWNFAPVGFPTVRAMARSYGSDFIQWLDFYDALKPFAAQLDMAHPARVKAITAAKKKNDRIDARTLADLLRCNLLPTCYVASPEIRELRRLLRYRNLVVQQSVRMQNKIAGLLMESGDRLQQGKTAWPKIFRLAAGESGGSSRFGEGISLRLSRGALETFQVTQKRLDRALTGAPRSGATSGPLSQHSRHRRDHCLNLGLGSWRSVPLRFFGQGNELLWFDCSVAILRRQAAAGANLQTAQSLAADRSHRSSQASTPLECTTGGVACSRTRARAPQSSHSCRSSEAGYLSARCRQTMSAIPGPTNHAGAIQLLRMNYGDVEIQSTATRFPHPPQFQLLATAAIFIDDLPAIVRPSSRSLLGDCAEEFLLPMLPSSVSRSAALLPNSIFVDGSALLFPQMDVWPMGLCFLASAKDRQLVTSLGQRLSGNTQVLGALRLPLTFTYHGCPRFIRKASFWMDQSMAIRYTWSFNWLTPTSSYL